MSSNKLVQYLEELGSTVKVLLNDEASIEEIDSLNPSHIVVSPGPCTPNEAGTSMAAIKHFAGKIPMLGVCLGHQCIAQVFGAEVVRAKQVMHGKTSLVHHNNTGVFVGLKNGLQSTRYHSLVINQQSLPSCLEVSAWTETSNGSIDEIMGIRHKELDIEGVQFHPEAILSEHGHDLLANFLNITTNPE